MDHKRATMERTLDNPRLPPWIGPQTDPLPALAARYAPVGLAEVGAMALLDRVDKKFVLTVEQMHAALAALQHDYRILTVGGQRLNHYRTLYFDTPDFHLYHMHVNGRADRYKVRSREYADSALSFLEVKHKTNKGRTVKARIATPAPVREMTREADGWLHGVFPYDSAALEPKVWNTFTRLTLVSVRACERVTLDVDLMFYTGSRTVPVDGVAVAEVKREREGQDSPFLAHMRAQNILPTGFSKYCVGVTQLYDDVKKNPLKPRLLQLAKMTHGGIRYE